MSRELITESEESPSEIPTFLLKQMKPLHALAFLDIEYLMTRTNHSEEAEAYANEFSEKVGKSTLFSLVLSVAFTMTGQRCFPTFYERIDFGRFFIDALVLFSPAFFGLLSLISKEMPKVREIKQAYILKRDPHILSFIYNVEKFYGISEESSMSLVLEPEDFEKWRKERYSYLNLF